MKRAAEQVYSGPSHKKVVFTRDSSTQTDLVPDAPAMTLPGAILKYQLEPLLGPCVHSYEEMSITLNVYLAVVSPTRRANWYFRHRSLSLAEMFSVLINPPDAFVSIEMMEAWKYPDGIDMSHRPQMAEALSHLRSISQKIHNIIRDAKRRMPIHDIRRMFWQSNPHAMRKERLELIAALKKTTELGMWRSFKNAEAIQYRELGELQNMCEIPVHENKRAEKSVSRISWWPEPYEDSDSDSDYEE